MKGNSNRSAHLARTKGWGERKAWDKKMKKSLTIIFTLFLLLFTACGKKEEEAEQSTVIVSDKKIEEIIIGDFGSEYYNVSELQAEIQGWIEQYASLSGTGEKVVLKGCETKGGVAIIQMEYATAADYKNFNGKEFFHGTVAQAYEAGYSMDGHLIDVVKKETMSRNEILEQGGCHIVILEDPLLVRTEGKILAVSENVEVVSSKEALVQEGSSKLSYVMYK
ncbi:hypothetical protein D7X25_15345 [bacterium 1XD42-8]|jgi:hypothetical protein|nr:hypothetical protein [Lachnospiraceae bacterium]RKJ52363.1 hypothetical protein D7X25_15345 [bacterium 1XD42-8]